MQGSVGRFVSFLALTWYPLFDVTIDRRWGECVAVICRMRRACLLRLACDLFRWSMRCAGDGPCGWCYRYKGRAAPQTHMYLDPAAVRQQISSTFDVVLTLAIFSTPNFDSLIEHTASHRIASHRISSTIIHPILLSRETCTFQPSPY